MYRFIKTQDDSNPHDNFGVEFTIREDQMALGEICDVLKLFFLAVGFESETVGKFFNEKEN